MARTVAALYDSRSEAELARARLVAETKARSPRIIAKDTAAAVDSLKIAQRDADAYREGLRRGAHLLVAEVSAGADAKRIVEILEQSASDEIDGREERSWGNAEQGVEVKLPERPRAQAPKAAAAAEPAAPEKNWPPHAPAEPMRAAAPPQQPAPDAVEDAHPAAAAPELRVGKRQVARGGARVRSFTCEAPAEEQVSLSEEIIDIDKRAADRELSEQEVEQGGLFKERVFEIAEMREEPIVTKVAVVREEIIVRKTIRKREETIRDTVRHTEVEVENVSPSDGTAARVFGPSPR